MLHAAHLALAALVLALWLAGSARMARGTRRLRDLPALAPVPAADAPPVTVVIAARDEARHLEHALASVLAQRYPRLQVVVVDDRSSDATPRILERMALAHPAPARGARGAPPAGWLGKNHALQRGTAAAAGEWILFTDADVVLEERAVARAVGYALREGYPAWPWRRTWTCPRASWSCSRAPSRSSSPSSRSRGRRATRGAQAHVGVGAFNLVRAAAYRALGGRAAIAMRPDDDLKLGKLLKDAGYRQDLLFGRRDVRVEWYASVGEVVRGLEKNTFAGLDYSLAKVLGATGALLLVDVWPFAAPFVTHGAARLLWALSAAVAMGLFAASTRGSGARPWYAPGFPWPRCSSCSSCCAPPRSRWRAGASSGAARATRSASCGRTGCRGRLPYASTATGSGRTRAGSGGTEEVAGGGAQERRGHAAQPAVRLAGAHHDEVGLPVVGLRAHARAGSPMRTTPSAGAAGPASRRKRPSSSRATASTVPRCSLGGRVGGAWTTSATRVSTAGPEPSATASRPVA